MRLSTIGVIASVLLTMGCQAGGGGGGGALTSNPQMAVAGSPVQFACPSGVTTRTTYDDGQNTTPATWQGSEASDPTVCLVSTRGRVRRFRYGMTELPLSGGEDDNKRILANVFSGSTENQCYEQKVPVTGGAGYYFGKECWRQLGRTDIPFNGKSTPVVVISETYDGVAGNAYAGDWTFYFDPVTHLFIKGETVNRRGKVNAGWSRAIVG